MPRVCEGPLGESQLRGALTHLLDWPAAVDFKRRRSRSPKKTLSATRKNIYLRRSYEPIGVDSGTTGHGPRYRQVRSHPLEVLRDPALFTHEAQPADYAEHSFLPRRADEFIRETEAFVLVRSLGERGRRSR